MTFDQIAAVPLVTADLPGIGGTIKQQPEDFEVEEVPAYEPSGQGDHLYLWIEKRGLGADYFARQLAQRLGIPRAEIGMAGLKDRHAVTRQWVSVPAAVADRVGQLDGDDIRVLNVSRHVNKLKPGHLHGNRFRILIRDADPRSAETVPPLLARLDSQGLANYYGSQRFGRGGETAAMGFALLQGERPPDAVRRSAFLRKLALSAAQSALFNRTLGTRLTDGLLRTVLDGDVMGKVPFGGMFRADDVPTEQRRFDAREIVHMGPMFGRKTFPAARTAAGREAVVLASAGLTSESFHGFGKLVQGTRRHNVIYLNDLTASFDPAGVHLAFTLPAGCYATVLLAELMKCPITDPDGENRHEE